MHGIPGHTTVHTGWFPYPSIVQGRSLNMYIGSDFLIHLGNAQQSFSPCSCVQAFFLASHLPLLLCSPLSAFLQASSSARPSSHCQGPARRTVPTAVRLRPILYTCRLLTKCTDRPRPMDRPRERPTFGIASLPAMSKEEKQPRKQI